MALALGTRDSDETWCRCIVRRYAFNWVFCIALICRRIPEAADAITIFHEIFFQFISRYFSLINDFAGSEMNSTEFMAKIADQTKMIQAGMRTLRAEMDR